MIHPPQALVSKRLSLKWSQPLIPLRPRRRLILPQFHQQLPKPLLPRPTRPTLRPLATQIHQLRNTLPTRTSTTRILSIRKEFLGFFACLSDRLVFFRVVVFIEVVDGRLGGLYGFGFLAGGGFGALGEGGVAAFAPLSASGY